MGGNGICPWGSVSEADQVELYIGFGRAGSSAYGLQSVSSEDTLSTMIKRFSHAGLRHFFETGAKSGIQPHHAPRLSRQLKKLDTARTANDMNVPGWKLHPLSAGRWSVWVNGNWRMTFEFEGGDAILVNYEDYH